jgi:hypothetical protein
MAEQLALAEVGTEPGGEVAQLIALAINKYVAVEVLERLFDLQVRVERRDARSAFFAAVAAFQEECPEIVKDKRAEVLTRKGSTYYYSYAPLDTIARTIRPILKRHRLSYSWTTEKTDNPGVLDVVCILRHKDGHEERATFPTPIDTAAAMSGAQKNGAALTYGRRQSLVSVLGLVTADDDPDAPLADTQPISKGQAAAILDKILATGSDLQKFCAYMGVQEVEQISAGDFERAIAVLNRKAAR